MANHHTTETQTQTQDATAELHLRLAVVMVPLAAQGHLNQLLHLSRLISARNIPVHFTGAAVHNRQAKTRLQGWDPSSHTHMHFHDFPIPPFPNPPPNPTATAKFPSHLFPSINSTTHLRQPIYDLVRQLAATVRRVVVIYDSMMAYVVQDIYSLPNAESYCFRSIPPFAWYSLHWEEHGKPVLPAEAEIVKEVPSMDGCFSLEFFEYSKLQEEAPKLNSGDLYNTSRAIEAEGFYLDLLGKEKAMGTDKIWAIGPFNPVFVSEEKQNNRRDKCLEWLDKQGPNSVIFVSFGTTSSLSDEQIFEIALGLERSQHKFIWVLRDADKGNVFEGDVRKAPLPENYERRVEGRGLIIREWAPQLEILRHPSTGGFISHCGWNSCIESISMGVPIGTWPMHSDQPRNAVFITKVLKIGVEIKDWENRDEVVSSTRVEIGVRRLMGSKEGDETRKRAAELGDAVRKSVMEGGVTCKEMNSFISHISR